MYSTKKTYPELHLDKGHGFEEKMGMEEKLSSGHGPIGKTN